MLISRISARRRPEFLNLQIIWGFIILAIIAGAGGTFAVFEWGGRELTGKVDVNAAIGQGALLAGLSLASAATLGFLFAVPRSLRFSHGREAGESEAWGTSLENIADWIVKMVIGAGLVALGNFDAISHNFQAFVAIGEGTEWGGRTGTLVVLYFGVMGFLGGYTVSRMQFLLLLDRSPVITSALQSLKRIPIGPEGLQRAGLTIEELTAVEAFSRLPQSQLRSHTERRQWAKAQLLASGGDLKAARALYEELVRDDPDARLYAEYRAVVHRIGDPEAAGLVETNRGVVEKGADWASSARAAIDQMFASLYQPWPDGFEQAISIGEDLVQRVQDASVWAYLACAYGQKYRYSEDQPSMSRQDLDRMRERALFCVKQALDLDAGHWRPTLRALWDRNAIRPSGDDDLVAFSGDAQFAALLDPDGMPPSTSISENFASLGSAFLGGHKLIRYSGIAQLWLVTAGGSRVEGEKPVLGAGQAYRLVMRLVPEAAASEAGSVEPDITEELKIIEGEDRLRVDFEFRPDAADVRFSPDRGSVSAMLTAPTPECDFSFQAPNRPGEQQIYVEILQGRRIIRTLTLEVIVGGPDG